MKYPTMEEAKVILLLVAGLAGLIMTLAIAWKLAGLNKARYDAKNKTFELSEGTAPARRRSTDRK